MASRIFSLERIADCAELYINGLSLAEVSQQTGVGIHVLRYNFKQIGVELRPPVKIHRIFTEKVCTKCKELKHVEDFTITRISSVSGLPCYGWCKPCSKAAAIRSRNPHKIKLSRIARVYGVTADEYTKMVVEQKGRCYICKSISTNNLSVDHDHITGKVRKLLCLKCNSALGFLNDDINIARRLVNYLRIHKEDN